LVDEPDSVDHTRRTPLEIAGDAGSIDIVSILLALGQIDLRRLNANGNSILAKSAKYNNGIIKIFFKVDLSLAVQSKLDGTTLLYYAVYAVNAGNVKLV
jgi:ankyrin repeat protein